MMASSKLKMNQVDRESLYFGKYCYRGILKSTHLYYANRINDIDQYTVLVKEIVAEQRTWRGKIKLEDINFIEIEKIIQFKKLYDSECTYRHEGDKVAVYTNNIDILSELVKVQNDAELTQIVLSPAGTKYFKLDPPAKFRSYLKNKRIDADTRESLIDFFETRDLVRPSGSLLRGLKSNSQYRNSWVSSTQYIDYDDDTTTTYLSLVFSGIIGKSYKLEKKTD